MILENLNIIGQNGATHIRLTGNKIGVIASVQSLPGKDEPVIKFENAIAFPGLINSHDHLDFDLFPQTGNKNYKSYIEWGADIQAQNRKSIDSILNIPKQLRIQWGIYKNLLNGITTVVNHGEHLEIKDPVINIFQNCYSLHSVRREKLWKLKLNRPFAKNQPFVIHAGEGTDTKSFKEVSKLIRWNLFKRKLVAVHGVAMSAQQARAFEALVWCPASNFFLLNATGKIDELRKQTKILFGTDSTLTASWNIWDQLRQARHTNLVTDDELFGMLTINPAKTWRMSGIGKLQEGNWGDLVVASRGCNLQQWDQFYNLNPENLLLATHRGNIRLFDSELLEQVKNSIRMEEFSRIYINGISKHVQGDLPKLMHEIRKYKADISFPVDCD